MRYCFGPVQSRRLGVSLGVDVVPIKTCTLDCIYCECGRTTCLTDEIREYVPADDVIAELDSILSSRPDIDVITFSGGGEPTLHSEIGRIINHCKQKYPYPIAVLTNGTLLWKPEVRRQLHNADIVIPSLDAASPSVFSSICKPHSGLSISLIIDGLKTFRQEYAGMLILEIFIVPGINDTEHELQQLAAASLSIQPDRIQLNYLDRPGAEQWVRKADIDSLKRYAGKFKPIPVDIPGTPEYRSLKLSLPIKEMILNTIARRPSTVDDLAYTLGEDKKIIELTVQQLAKDGVISSHEETRGKFYSRKSGKTV